MNQFVVSGGQRQNVRLGGQDENPLPASSVRSLATHYTYLDHLGGEMAAPQEFL